MIIAGRTSLLQLIEREKAVQGLSDAELLRRAGLSSPFLFNLRNRGRRSISLSSVLALVNALGFELTVTPEQSE